MTYLHAPLSRFVLLAEGWRLPFVVEPCIGHHGQYAITMYKPEDQR